MTSKHLKWTGERLTTQANNSTVAHHLHRYALAIEIATNKNVLDIACGEGYGSNFLAKNATSVIGVDIDAESINHAKNKYTKQNLTFIIGSANKIPVSDSSIDLAVSFETIEHHDKHIEMLLELKRVLKSDGILIISSPDKATYSKSIKNENHFHVKELHKKEFQSLLNQHFKYVKMFNQNVSYNSIIVPENGEGNSFKEYKGDFEIINSISTLSDSVFNIGICSNQEIDTNNIQNISTFNASNALNEIINREQEILNSITYKIGYYTTLPIRWLKSLFH